MVQRLKIIKRKAFEAEIAKLQEGALKIPPHLQWVHVENRFAPGGVKMIDVFCYEIRNMNFIDPQKYIAGFQIIPNEVPGFGPITFNEAKISMRVPAVLEKKIVEQNACSS